MSNTNKFDESTQRPSVEHLSQHALDSSSFSAAAYAPAIVTSPASSYYRQNTSPAHEGILHPQHTYIHSLSKVHASDSSSCSPPADAGKTAASVSRPDEVPFSCLSPALKHLTDSLTLDQSHYQLQQHRQHLHQFLQHQHNQQRLQQQQQQHHHHHNLLHQQSSLTNHMLSALHQNGSKHVDSYEASKSESDQHSRQSPASKSFEHGMKNVHSHNHLQSMHQEQRSELPGISKVRTNPPNDKGNLWQDGCSSGKSTAVSSHDGSQSNLLNQHYAAGSTFPYGTHTSNSLSAHKLTDNVSGVELHHHMTSLKSGYSGKNSSGSNTKRAGSSNVLDEGDSTEYSQDGSVCPELPLETTLHEDDDCRESDSGSYGPFDINNRGKCYRCSICPFVCRKQIELTNHVGIHPDEKPFHCIHCDYKGAKYHYLRNHLLTHSSQKVHECPECDYKSYNRGAIKVHMRKHSPEKRFACPTCSYRTHFKGNLKLHLRVHSGEKPYACTVCDFKCTQSGSLKIHMRGHSGEKPYACSACDYRTKHKGNLVMHQRKHSGDRPYRCEHCSYTTAQKMALTKHNKAVHGIEPPPTVRDRYQNERMAVYSAAVSSASEVNSHNSSTQRDSEVASVLEGLQQQSIRQQHFLNLDNKRESVPAIKPEPSWLGREEASITTVRGHVNFQEYTENNEGSLKI